MKKQLGYVLLLVVSTWCSAQTLPKIYNQFFMNPYIYNPAYAGVEGHTVLFFMYKKQWTGINDAPSFVHANFHVPLKGGIAIGAMAYSETNGLYRQSAGKVSAGYLVTVDREHFIRFGMSLGAGNNTINFGEFDSPSDPAFQNLLETENFLIGDVGVTYHTGHFNVGVSLPNIFTYDFFTTDSNTPIRVKPQDNIFIKANYRGHISDDIAFEPHILYRYNKYLKDQYEATMIVHLLHIVWVGATYRQDAGFVGLLGAKFLEKIGVGYAYQYGNPNTAGLLGPTHEIHLGYHLGTKKAHAEHVSSFIKSHKTDAEARAKQAELERQRKLQALQKSRQPAPAPANDDALGLLAVKKPEPTKATPWNYEKESDPIERVNEFGETERGLKFDRINEKGEKEVVFSWLPPPPPGVAEETYEIADASTAPIIRVRPDGTKEAGIKWLRTLDNGEKETLIIYNEILPAAVADEMDHNPTEAASFGEAKFTIRRSVPEPVVEKEPEPVVEKQPEPVVEKQPEPVVEPEPVKVAEPRTKEQIAAPHEPVVHQRGSHLLELPPGTYVVAGTFKSFDNAENVSDKLFLRGFHDVKVGHLSETGYYYVVLSRTTNTAIAQKERKRISQLSGLSEVWVLTVNQ